MATELAVPAHQFDDLEQQHEAGTLGMWLFLATEVMVFGTLFTGYTVYRTSYSEAFEVASCQLNLTIGAANTVVLLTSSLTMALSVHTTRVGNRNRSILYLVLTAFLGTLFMLLKAVEYYSDYRDNLVPRLAFNPTEWTERGVQPERVQLFLLFYYCMTGLHALHLTIGIAVVVILIILVWRSRLSAVPYMPIEVSGLYWHFVDIIWIFLLPLLYLIGTRAKPF